MTLGFELRCKLKKHETLSKLKIIKLKILFISFINLSYF